MVEWKETLVDLPIDEGYMDVNLVYIVRKSNGPARTFLLEY